jgi:GH24 family phage-related lysozyme (muramidase)
MTRVRVDTEELRQTAAVLDSVDSQLMRITQKVESVAATLPSYDGQLSGPARGAGLEARNQSSTISRKINSHSQQLICLAGAFEKADQTEVAEWNETVAMLAHGKTAFEKLPISGGGNLVAFDSIFWDVIPASWHISKAGIDMIIGYEGFYPTLKEDPAGNCTIGFGHMVHTKPCDGRPSEKPFNNGLTKEQAYELMRKDIAIAEQAVRDLVKVPLTQNQFDALTSFAFNLGTGYFASSDLLALVNKGEYDKVPEEFNRYVKANDDKKYPGLVSRRKKEGDLFAKKDSKEQQNYEGEAIPR